MPADQHNRTPPDSTELAPKKTVGDWRAVRPSLPQAPPDVWSEVVQDFYYARLKSRYLAPIEAIRKMGQSKGKGFAIVAIQCSLIEFLESCFQGVNYRFRAPRTKTEYSNSEAMFVEFLTSHQPFAQQFDKRLATDFYKSVRCGLLHEARTKGAWRILAKSAASLIVDPTGPVLYRDDMQTGIDRFIENYCSEVPHKSTLQEAFLGKFNHLCT